MKVRYIIMCLMTLLALSGQAKKHKQLVILHTNDTHSQIFPFRSQLPDTVKAGRSGFLRRLNMLKEERKKHPDLLYLTLVISFRGRPISPCSREKWRLGS